MSLNKPGSAFNKAKMLGLVAVAAANAFLAGGSSVDAAQRKSTRVHEGGSSVDATPLRPVHAFERGSEQDVILALKEMPAEPQYDSEKPAAWKKYLGPFSVPHDLSETNLWPAGVGHAEHREGKGRRAYANFVRVGPNRVLTATQRWAGTTIGNQNDSINNMYERGLDMVTADRTIPPPYSDIPLLKVAQITPGAPDVLAVTVLGYRADEQGWMPDAHHGTALRLAENKFRALRLAIGSHILKNMQGVNPERIAILNTYLTKIYALPLPNGFPEKTVYPGAPVISTEKRGMPEGVDFGWFGVLSNPIVIGGVPVLLIEGPEALREVLRR